MTAFLPGDIVVYRVGDGSAPLTSQATAVFLDEYKPDGTLVQSIAMPTSTVGASHALTASGTATTAGMLTTSGDGRFLLLTGNDAAPEGVAGGGVVGRVNVAGTTNTTTVLSGYGGSIRSAASDDGIGIYVAGNDGVTLTTYGSNGAGTSIADVNARQIGLFNGQLYSSSGGASLRLGTVGVGEPTTPGQTVADLPGISTSNLASPYGFVFADLSSDVAGVDTLYVADEGLGLRKFSLVGSSWSLNGSIGTNSDGYHGLTASVSGTQVTLFATRSNGSGSDTLVSLIDASGYNGVFSGEPVFVGSAGPNAALRGVALAPQTPTIALQTQGIAHKEGNAGTAPFTFTLTRSNAYGNATVDYTVTGGTGVNGTDFVGGVLPSGKATFTAGSLTATVIINVAGDKAVEADETFTLSLSNPTAGYAFGAKKAQIGTIQNDDTTTSTPPNGISLAPSSVPEFAKPGTAIGTLSAIDPDVGDTFTFALLDDAGGRFALSGNTLIVARGLLLDFEQAAINAVKVQVTDSQGHDLIQSLDIKTEDVNPEVIVGSAANDKFVGGASNDRLSGQAGRDILIGGAGSDKLAGETNDDILSGGLGRDYLTGGTGKDAFLFNTKPSTLNYDHIRDFRPVDDVIRLENTGPGLFTKLHAAYLKSKEFVTINSATQKVGADDHILYDRKHGTLYYDSNGGTASGRVEFAVIDNHAALTWKDFLIV